MHRLPRRISSSSSSDDTRMQGRTTIVTGAASGIGAAVSERLVRDGWMVVGLDRDADGLALLESRLGPWFKPILGDVRDEEAHRVAVTHATTIGTLAAAVNAAGIAGRSEPIAHSDLSVWESTLDVNAGGVYLGLRAQIPAMPRGGSIVNIASVLGCRAEPGFAAYVASKHALLGLTKTAALECATAGIRVNAVLPGYTDTPLLRTSSTAEEIAVLAAQIPLGRLARTAEIADAVSFLLAPGSGYITGLELIVDGGYLLR